MPAKPKPKPNTKRRVVGYVRISVDREEQTSTESQEASIRAYCQAHGWVVADVIVEKGRSAYGAKRQDRPGLKQATRVVEAGAADTLIVWKVDRAARNALDLLRLVDELDTKYDAKFVSVTENFDTTTPMGRAMLTIVAALAEMESATKSVQALSWHEGRRGRGDVPAGRPPLGYIKTGRNELEPDPVTAPLIAEAVDRVLAGESIASILRWINDEGVEISRPGFTTTLHSPTIAGFRSSEPLDVRNGVRLVPDSAVMLPGSWEPIVDPDKWVQMRAILRDPARRTSPGGKLKYPLVPILRCGVCGSKMLRQNQKKRSARYICVGVKDRPGGRCLNAITQGPVDEWVTADVLARLDDSTWRAMRATGDPTGPDPEVIRADLEAMWQLVLARKLDHEEYAEAKALWEGELAAASSPEANLPDVDSVRDAWDSLTPMQQHVVFRQAIKSLVINASTRMGRGVDRKRIALDVIE